MLLSIDGAKLASRFQQAARSSSVIDGSLHQRQHRRAKRCCLAHQRAIHWKINDVGQKLHQPVIRRHPAIDPHHRRRDAFAGDGGEQIIRW